MYENSHFYTFVLILGGLLKKPDKVFTVETSVYDVMVCHRLGLIDIPLLFCFLLIH